MSIYGAGCRLFPARLIVGLLLLAQSFGYASSADFIRTDGTRLVDGHHETFAVNGINLGNWLFPEAYLFRLKARGALTPADLTNTIERLIGPEQAARFWAEFRDVYVAQEDSTPFVYR
jgi:endoglucanase